MQPSSEAATVVPVAVAATALAAPATINGAHPITGRQLNARLFQADCRDVLRSLADNSIDSVVTDPPYALVSIVKRFGKPGSAPAVGNDAYQRASAGFMGKQWDTGETAFSKEFWAEVLRVLKPGGHAVAFSGTRTYHRMAVAIEDAGFEIRDQLGWLYGSGFAKSHSVELGLWNGVINCQSKDNAPLVVQISEYSHLRSDEGKEHIAAAPALILPEGAPALIIATGKEGDLSEVTVMSLSASEAESISLNTGWSWEKSLVENSDPRSMYTTETKSKQITTTEIWKSLTSLITRKSTRHNATLQNGWPWPVVAAESSSSDASMSKSGIPILTVLGNAIWNPVARAKGIGSGLKPAWEPICLARKPLSESTVAANVLRWGTGALNIDGCRVGDDAGWSYPKGRGGEGWHGRESLSSNLSEPIKATAGRWPANIAHDGSDEVLAGFPETGTNGTPKAARPTPGSAWGIGGERSSVPGGATYEDSGSAARFFYCAKASRADRDEGLANHVMISISGDEEWGNADLKVQLLVDTAQSAPKVIGVYGAQNSNESEWNTWLFGSEKTGLSRLISTYTTKTETSSITILEISNCSGSLSTSESTPAVKCETESGGSHAENAENSATYPITINEPLALALGVSLAASQTRLRISASVWRSTHPTVKPTALMQWLCRMVTPPGGTVLDPFMGSGSTGKAALREGFDFVGCEREDEYMPIALARVASGLRVAPVSAPKVSAANDNGTPDLFSVPQVAGAA